jgi:hypothetical protein
MKSNLDRPGAASKRGRSRKWACWNKKCLVT